MEKETFLPQDIYNFDETGFQIRCLRKRLVVTNSNQKAPYVSDPDCRESITIVEMVSADGRVSDPLVIIQGAIFMEKHFNNDLTDSTLLAVRALDSPMTSSLSAIFVTFISRHVFLGTQLLSDGRPRTSPHYRVDAVFDNNGIILFLLPPHSTHLLSH